MIRCSLKVNFKWKKIGKQNKVLLNINILYTCKMGKAYILQINHKRPQYVYIGGVFCKFWNHYLLKITDLIRV